MKRAYSSGAKGGVSAPPLNCSILSILQRLTGVGCLNN